MTKLLFSLLNTLTKFSIVSAFLTSLIKFILWLKFSTDKRKAEDKFGEGLGVSGEESCSISMLERLKTGGGGDDRGWDGWMASPTQWMWVWASSERWWKTGKPNVTHGVTKSWTPLSDWTTTCNYNKRLVISKKYLLVNVLYPPT